MYPEVFSKLLFNYNKKIIDINRRTLGRWILKNDCEKKETIAVFWANSDHCGDSICGNPLENKKILDEKLNKIKSS